MSVFPIDLKVATRGVVKIIRSSGGDDTAMIQAALNLGGAIYLAPGVFNVSLNGTTYPGRGVGLALDISSNTHLYGPGVIYPTANTGNFAVLGNSSASISNVRIEVRMDGSRLLGTGQAASSGIVLFNSTDCDVSGSRVENIPSSGIMFRCTGASVLNAILTVRAVATNCYINNIGFIGLQFNRAVNSRASNNVIRNAVDNCIDFEGNDEAGSLPNAGLGGTNLIQNNILDGGNVGVFLESQGNCIVSGNIGRNLNVGVFANRIHSGALHFSVQNNRFHARPGNGGSITRGAAGILIHTFSGLGTIEGNHFDGFVNGMSIGAGFAMDIGKNTYSNIQTYLINAARATNALVQSRITEQVYMTEFTSYYPKNFPPNAAPGFVRTLNTTVAEAWYLYGAVPLSSARSTTGTLTTRGDWATSSIFYAGETNVSIQPLPAALVWAYNAGVWYQIGVSASGFEPIVKNEAGVQGNYTAAFPPGRVIQMMSNTAYLEFKNN